MKNNRIYAVLLMTAALLSLSACGGSKSAGDTPAEPAEIISEAAEDVTAEENAPVTFVNPAPTEPAVTEEAPVEEPEVTDADTLTAFDPEDYIVYESGDGFSIRLPEDMEVMEHDTLSLYCVNNSFGLTVLRESFAEFEALGYSTEGMTLEDYKALVEAGNGNEFTFTDDGFGNPCTVFQKSIDNKNFSYYATVRLGSDAGWTVNLFCYSEYAYKYLPLFEQLANTIVVD